MAKAQIVTFRDARHLTICPNSLGIITQWETPSNICVAQ